MIRRCRFEDGMRPVRTIDLHRAMIPERFWRATLGAITGHPAFLPAVAADLAPAGLKKLTEAGVGRLLIGDANAGKTSIAVLYAKAVIAHRGSALFLPVRDLRRVCFQADSNRIPVRLCEDNPTIIDRARVVTLLILDDFGSVGFKADSASMDALESLLRDRYDAKGSVILTSNLTSEQIRAGHPESVLSIVDRLVSPLVVENNQWPTLRA